MITRKIRPLWLATAAAVAFHATAIAQPKLVPVPITLPKPGYEGTPPNVTGIPNLEKPTGKERPPFLAPEGVKNVAKGKKVTSSEKQPILGELEMITDGDVEQIEGNSVELGRGVQWVQIDLESPHEIYGVLFWHHHQPRVYLGVIVRTADDEAFTKNVQTWFNNDYTNKAGLGAGKNLNYMETYEGKLVDCKGVAARYVRLYSAGSEANEFNDYMEVEVLGRPVK